MAENDLISRSAQIEKFTAEAKKIAANDKDFAQALMYVVTCLDAAPAVDAVEVKHGFNSKQKASGDDAFECSICGYEDWDCMTCEPKHHNYCPNCGAKMDLEGN